VSVNKLTRGDETLVSNVKALTQQVKVLSGLVNHMSKMMRPTTPEEEARNQLH
jgi:tetrahydromethanopterin S-methyltransferase subunit B